MALQLINALTYQSPGSMIVVLKLCEGMYSMPKYEKEEVMIMLKKSMAIVN